MSRKKNRSNKKIFENMSVEPDAVDHSNTGAELPAENNADLPESTQEASETPAEDLNQVEAKDDAAATDESAAQSSATESEETSPDDLLEDMRRSLIEEEETREKEEQPKWWKR